MNVPAHYMFPIMRPADVMKTNNVFSFATFPINRSYFDDRHRES